MISDFPILGVVKVGIERHRNVVLFAVRVPVEDLIKQPEIIL